MSSVGVRFAILCGGIVLCTGSLFGGGEYQQTRDGKTLVWNDNPQPGDTATWSGDRDGEGYAAGFGTLTWYTRERAGKPQLYARFFGNMVRGKLNGPINVHFKNNKTGHAIFVDGKKATRWAGGPVPSWRTPPLQVAQVSPASERTVAEDREEPEVPAEGPRETAESSSPPSPTPLAPVAFAGDVDDSLRLIAWPPPSLLRTLLRLKRVAGAPMGTTEPTGPAPLVVNPRRTKDEVIFLADAALRRSGKNPADYGRAEPQYEPTDGVWLVLYDRKSDDTVQHAAVAVGDRTAQASVVIGR